MGVSSSLDFDFAGEILNTWDGERRTLFLHRIHKAKLANERDEVFSGNCDDVHLPVSGLGLWMPRREFAAMVASYGLRLQVCQPPRRWWHVLRWLSWFDFDLLYVVSGWHSQGPPEPENDKGPADAGPLGFGEG